MTSSAYDLLSALARYWFIALGLFILFRMIVSVTREIRIERAVRDEIVEMGTGVGSTLILISDENKRLKAGKLYAVVGETTVGKARKCDICLHSPTLKRVHCILLTEENRVSLVPVGNAFVAVNGTPAEKKAYARDGAEIQIGGLLFRLRLEVNDE